jgi:hypothetical protein
VHHDHVTSDELGVARDSMDRELAAMEDELESDGGDELAGGAGASGLLFDPPRLDAEGVVCRPDDVQRGSCVESLFGRVTEDRVAFDLGDGERRQSIGNRVDQAADDVSRLQVDRREIPRVARQVGDEQRTALDNRCCAQPASAMFFSTTSRVC